MIANFVYVVDEFWKVCDWCENDSVKDTPGFPLICRVFMFFHRLRKNVPFPELSIAFEFHDLAELSSIFYQVRLLNQSQCIVHKVLFTK